MAEGKILFDPIFVGVMDRGRATETATALRILCLAQVPFAGLRPQNLSARRDLEPLCRRFLRFDAFGTSHKVFRLSKKSAHYKRRAGAVQAVILVE